MNARYILITTLLLSSALAPTVAMAQGTDADKATARDLVIEGYRALQSKDYTVAVDRFTRADALYHAPTVILGLARAHVGLGKLVSARELYYRTAHETLPPNASSALKKAVLDAQNELDALTPRIPGVILDIKGATSVKVTLDGIDVPAAALGVKRPADPGEHVIRAVSPGFLSREMKVTLSEGKTETVGLLLEPEQPKPVVAVAPPAPPPIAPPAPAPVPPPTAAPLPVAPLPVVVALPVAAPPLTYGPTSHTPSFILFGLAGAGAVLGIAFAGVGFSAQSAYDKAPTVDGADKIDRSALIADICFGSALLLGTAGLVTLLQKDPPSSTTGIFLSPRVGKTGAMMAAGIRF